MHQVRGWQHAVLASRRLSLIEGPLGTDRDRACHGMAKATACASTATSSVRWGAQAIDHITTATAHQIVRAHGCWRGWRQRSCDGGPGGKRSLHAIHPQPPACGVRDNGIRHTHPDAARGGASAT